MKRMAYRADDAPLVMLGSGRYVWPSEVSQWHVGHKVGLLLRFLVVIAAVVLMCLAGSADWPNQ